MLLTWPFPVGKSTARRDKFGAVSLIRALSDALCRTLEERTVPTLLPPLIPGKERHMCCLATIIDLAELEVDDSIRTRRTATPSAIPFSSLEAPALLRRGPTDTTLPQPNFMHR